MTLNDAVVGKEYIITQVDTGDDELDSFLFSLGCYSGEKITVVSRRHSTRIVAIKNGRYCIDSKLADTISIF